MDMMLMIARFMEYCHPTREAQHYLHLASAVRERQNKCFSETVNERCGYFLILQRTMDLYMKYCHSRQLRPKTMLSYEQTLKLFFAWLEAHEGITQVEAIRDKHIRNYIIELQDRGKYTFCAVDGSMNNPQAK